MNFWEWIIGQAADAFTPSGQTALDGALQQIFKQPLPPIDSPLFKQVFAITWALGIGLGILTGFFSATFYMGRSMTSIGDGLGVLARFTFFVRVFVFGLIAPPGTALALYVSHALTGLALKLPGMEDKPESISLLSVLAKVSDAITGAVVALLNWAASAGLQAQASALSILILIVLSLSPVFYGFSIVGDGGLALWRFWIALWMMPIVAIPVIAWVLAIGRLFTSWLNGLGGLFAVSASWGALLFLIMACLVPLTLFILFQHKVKERIQPAFVQTGAMTGNGGAGTLGATAPSPAPSRLRHAIANTATAAIGTRIAMHTDTESESSTATPRNTGSRRMRTGSALGTASTALKATHPVAGVALGVVGAGVAKSGRKSYDKAQAGQSAPGVAPNTAPSIPSGPSPVVTSVPSSQPQPLSEIVHQPSENSAPPLPSAFLPVKRRDQAKP
jgi:hypothetical protein